MNKRVVVTGMAGITAFGDHWDSVGSRLGDYRNAICSIPEWGKYEGLNTRLGGPILDYELPRYPRKKMRSMGRVAHLATAATELALDRAGLRDHPVLTSGDTGVSYGSSIGSTHPIRAFGAMLNEHSTRGVTANSYIQMMGHTTAVNIALFFGINGRIITTSSACTSGSQGIGYAYEAIKHGYQKVMVAGGAEELCPTEVAVFDTLFATSLENDRPSHTPRPFDAARDGLVIGEGAGTLVLEEYEHAIARGATIHAELVGFATNNDACHVTQPTAETMRVPMLQALDEAQIPASEVGYVCAHGTATSKGDIAESHASMSVFGSQTPISSLKSYFGHTLGACGAIEAWLSIEMMNNHWFAPTINLTEVDSNCAELDYIVEEGREIDTGYVVSNNFAFGGINTSLVFKRRA